MGETTSFLHDNPRGHTEFLVNKAVAGSRAAWGELYSRHRKMLVANIQTRIPGFARRIFDAEDLLQDAALRAHAELKNFRYRGENSLRRWLATLVVNEFLNQLKARQRELDHHSPQSVSAVLAGGAGQERSGQLSDEQAALLEAMGRMEEEEREILIMRIIEDLSFEQMAAILQVGRELARTKYTRAFERLERLLRA